MSVYPELRCCLRCGRSYPYNPDTGQLSCPACCLSGVWSLLRTLAGLVREDAD